MGCVSAKSSQQISPGNIDAATLESASIKQPSGDKESRKSENLLTPGLNANAVETSAEPGLSSSGRSLRAAKAANRRPSITTSQGQSIPVPSDCPSISSFLSVQTGNDSKPTVFASRILILCTNCEDPNCPPEFSCESCGENGTALVLCATCDAGIHKPAKMQIHRRKPFTQSSIVNATQSIASKSTSSSSSETPVTPKRSTGLFSGLANLITGRRGSKDEQIAAAAIPKADQRPMFKLTTVASVKRPSNAFTRQAKTATSMIPEHDESELSDPELDLEEEVNQLLREDEPTLGVPETTAQQRLQSSISKDVTAAPAPGTVVVHKRKSQIELEEDAMRPVIPWNHPYRQSAKLLGEVFSVKSEALHPTSALKVVSPFAPPFHGSVVMVACGLNHAGAVTSTGALFMWGSNEDHQLGLGKTGKETFYESPMHVPITHQRKQSIATQAPTLNRTITNISGTESIKKKNNNLMKSTTIMAKAGPLAVDTVQKKGGNLLMVATPNKGNSNEASEAYTTEEEKIVAIALSTSHTLALSAEGRVYSWGLGLHGVLGLGSDADKDVPTEVEIKVSNDTKTQPRAVSIACSQYNGAVVCEFRDADMKRQHSRPNRLFTWGAAQSGQLGTGDQIPSLIPKQADLSELVPGDQVVSVALGSRHAALLSHTGRLYTWGDNEFGQCGSSEFKMSTKPRLLQALSGNDTTEPLHKIVQVACGERHTTVVSEQGRVWSWGSGESQQLGINSESDQFMPMEVQFRDQYALPSAPITRVAIGQNICAGVTATGEVYMWGYGVDTPIPKLIVEMKTEWMQQIALGNNENIVALTGSPQTIFRWHFNSHDGKDAESFPSQFYPLRGKWLAAMSCGTSHTAVVTATGHLMVWGQNDDGQLGTGNTIHYMLPTTLALKCTIKTVKCSVEHTLALSVSGEVLSWGVGAQGKLGHGNDKSVLRPKPISGLLGKNITFIAVGPSNSAALTRDGQGWVWGTNTHGQLGCDDALPRFSPVRLSENNYSLVDIAFGTQHGAAVTDKGVVYSWGNNEFGQLGTGSGDASGLMEVASLKNIRIKHIGCGEMCTVALSQDGDIYAWGSGETKQTGIGSGEDQPLPVKVPIVHSQNKSKIINVSQLSVGSINCLVNTDDGEFYVWGFNFGEVPNRVSLVHERNNKALMSCGATSLMIAP